MISAGSNPLNWTLPSSGSGSSIKKPIKGVSKPCFGCDCGDEECDCCICTVMWGTIYLSWIGSVLWYLMHDACCMRNVYDDSISWVIPVFLECALFWILCSISPCGFLTTILISFLRLAIFHSISMRYHFSSPEWSIAYCWFFNIASC